MTNSRDGLIVLIGVFKLTKAALLSTLGVAALAVEPQKMAHAAERAINSLGIFAGHLLFRVVDRLWSVDQHTARMAGLLLLAYAAVFSVEGCGLLMRRRWAEWLTVFVTGSFIPFEVYELIVHFGAGKAVALAVNLAIVVFLIWRRTKGSRR